MKRTTSYRAAVAVTEVDSDDTPGPSWPPPVRSEFEWLTPDAVTDGSSEIIMKFSRPVRERAESQLGLGFEWELVELENSRGCVVVVTSLLDNDGVVCPRYAVDDEGYRLDHPVMPQRGDIVLEVGTGELMKEPELRISHLLAKAGEVHKLRVKVLRVASGSINSTVAFRLRAAAVCELQERKSLLKSHCLHARELLMYHQDILANDEVQYKIWLSEAHRGCGDINLAIRSAESALELSNEHGSRSQRREALATVARHCILALELNAAKFHLWAELTLAEELGDLNAATVSLFHLASLPTLEKAIAVGEDGLLENVWSAIISSADLLGTSMGLADASWKYRLTFVKDTGVEHLLERCIEAGKSAKSRGSLSGEAKYLSDMASSLLNDDKCIIS